MKEEKIKALNTETGQEEEITVLFPETEEDFQTILDMTASGELGPETSGDVMHQPGEGAAEATADGTATFKGGPGSGFAGHAGRPGKVGGSTARDTESRLWEEVNQPGPVTVFHGTDTQFINRIMNKGLKRGQEWMDRPPSVYFCSSINDAFTWGAWAKHNFVDHSIFLVEFEIPDRFDSEVQPDPIGAKDMMTPTAFRIERDIPKEYIRSIKRYDYKAWIDDSNITGYSYTYTPVKTYYERPEEPAVEQKSMKGYVLVLIDDKPSEEKELDTIANDTIENDDWMKTLPGYENEENLP